MATVRDFRDLRCWQEARRVTRDIYALTAREPFSKDFGLRDQMQRAAVSIGSNIAEGFERDSNPELVKFLSYAKGSTGEVLSQLHTAFDVGYVPEMDFQDLVLVLKQLGSMIAKFQNSVKSAAFRGRYHRPSPAPTPNQHPATSIPNPGPRNTQLETRNQQLETRNQQLETRNPQPATRNQQPHPLSPEVMP